MRCGEHILLFDAGSGARAAGEVFRESEVGDGHRPVLHALPLRPYLGLSLFRAALSIPKIKLSLWSGHLAGLMTTKEMVSAFMRPPWFPAELEICKARFGWHDFRAGDVLRPKPGVVVRTASLNHPGGCIGYRVEWGGRAVAYVTDTEHVDGELDQHVLGLIDDADLVIYDSHLSRRGDAAPAWLRPFDLAARRETLQGGQAPNAWRCSITIRCAPISIWMPSKRRWERLFPARSRRATGCSSRSREEEGQVARLVADSA